MQQHLQRPLPLAGHQGGGIKKNYGVVTQKNKKRGLGQKKKKKNPLKKLQGRGLKKKSAVCGFEMDPQHCLSRDDEDIFIYI